MRRPFALLALALVALAAGSAAPATAAPDSSPATFAMSVPSARGPTPFLRAPRRFDLLGLRWRGRASAPVRLRVRLANGRWTRWASADGPAAEPVWTGAANALQLRMPRGLRGVRVHFVAVPQRGLTRAAAASTPRAAAAQADGQPRIIPRSAWAGRACRPRGTPTYGRIQLAFVHHTDNLNGYGPRDSAAMVLAICLFHRDVNGWGDIGYNFVVDRYGQIFEGHAGGIDRPVVGTHTAGFNKVSTGVANLGTFDSRSQTPAGLRALEQLLAWKLTLHGVPALGRLTLRTTEPGLRDLPLGTPIRVNRIAGHRDANSTDCPGSALEADLPKVRRAVAALAAPLTSVGLAATRDPVRYGDPVVLSGRIARADGAAVPGAPVAVQVPGAGGGFVTVATTTTAADGTWSAALPIARNTTFRAVYGGGAARAAVSPTLPVGVAPVLSLAPLPRTVAPRVALSVSGTIRPGMARLTVTLDRRTRRGYRTVARRTIGAAAGTFATALRAPAGRYRLRVAFAGDRDSAPVSASASIAFM